MPRIDVEKICLYDSWLSWPLVGRILATFAELSFMAQLSYTLYHISQHLLQLTGQHSNKKIFSRINIYAKGTPFYFRSVFFFFFWCRWLNEHFDRRKNYDSRRCITDPHSLHPFSLSWAPICIPRYVQFSTWKRVCLKFNKERGKNL